MKKRNPARIILAAMLLILAFSAPFWLPSYYLQLSSRALILAITTMSFILLAGFGGMTSLAQMSFFAASGYGVGYLAMTRGWPFGVAIPAAILIATGLSAAFALLAIRAKGIYFLMITLALSQVTYGIAMQWSAVTKGSEGFSGITRPSIFGWSLIEYTPMFYLTLVVSIVCFLLLKRLVSSPFGLAVQGIRDNPVRMAALGFDVQRHRFTTLTIAGLFAGIAGVLGVFYYGGVSPTTTSLSQTLLVVMSAIAGGVMLIEGGILGSFITVFLWSLASQATQRYLTIIGLVFVLIILFLPNGVLGSKNLFQGLFSRRKEKSVEAGD
jgi:branched-chain amino acid transport system permease protein